MATWIVRVGSSRRVNRRCRRTLTPTGPGQRPTLLSRPPSYGDLVEDGLSYELLERLIATGASDRVTDLVLAACLGDAELATALEGDAIAPQRPEHPVAADRRPLGAFVRSVRVEGFRGIGPPAVLDLHPSVGLTVVTGRNGSGKSSFAEALEVLLTGTADRLRDDQPSALRDGWRNLHSPEPCSVRAELVIEGLGGTTVVERTWPAGVALGDGATAVRFPGERTGPFEQLGWRQDLVAYRPFLAHGELEAMFGKPSALYDRLSEVLGLDDLTDAHKRLTAARRAVDDVVTTAGKDAKRLVGVLAGVDDERARTCMGAMKGTAWDVATVRDLATGGSATDDGASGALAALAALTLPDPERVSAAVDELRHAAGQWRAVLATDAERSRQLARLLRLALTHEQQHEGGVCPVCGTGLLDDTWRTMTQDAVARLDTEAADAERAHTAAARARANATALASEPPSALQRAETISIDVTDLSEAWQVWGSPPTGAAPGELDLLAEHLLANVDALVEAGRRVVEAARSQLAERELVWRPIATELSAWVVKAEPALAAAQTLKELKTAEAWMKEAMGALRNQRLAPIAARAQEVWEQLRHESSVTLEGIELTGTANRRGVDLNVTVDGVEGAALGVMSQGEINALALSVFLPRATLPASPFRFLVIDDPVQAMDPAKVDGLARVLAQVAADRQVIVFTHDDRLPASIRRLRLKARLVEVRRSSGSSVEVRETGGPTTQSLADAGALAADERTPLSVKRRVVPVLCRGALEAALIDRYRARRLAAGARHAEVDVALGDVTTLTQLAALSLFDDAGRGGDVLPKMRAMHPRFADAYQAVNKGAHGPYNGNLGLLVGDVKALVQRPELA